jgi:cell division protein FtsI (penicillin-binding protein 3)
MFLGVCIVLSLFAVQLLRLQALDASAMAKQALAGRLTTTTVPANRGDILDRNGAVLATSLERYDVTVDQRAVPKYFQYVRDAAGHKQKQVLGLDGAVRDLAPLLEMSEGDLRAKLDGRRGFVYVKKGITPQAWRAVKAVQVPGIYAERTSTRFYPGNGLGSSVIGFMGTDPGSGTDLVPRAGIEQSWNAKLNGRAGSVTYERDPKFRQIAGGELERKPAVDGSAVELTIDRDLQWRAEKLLAAKVKETKALSGVVVVMRKDGTILALANAPGFNPNDTRKAKAENMYNRALSEVYEPGSTGKVMTAAAALEEGAVTPSTPFTVNATVSRAGKTFHDSHAHPPEHLTFAGVLATSSNVGTILAGEKLSPATMYRYLTGFGIGQPSGLKFPGESRGILADVKDWSGSQRYTVLFGQGLSVNAVQAAGVYQTIANDGVRVAPQLVTGTRDESGRLHKAPAARQVRVVSPETAKAVRTMLEGVVSAEGTAPEAKIEGYRVAGKTGTAQRVDPECSCYQGYTGSFIGMAPADDPQLVVAVTLQRPTNGYFGGVVAAPVFHDVMTYALQKLQIPPTGTASPKVSITAGDR